MRYQGLRRLKVSLWLEPDLEPIQLATEAEPPPPPPPPQQFAIVFHVTNARAARQARFGSHVFL
jgi:hypothetical protein